MDRVSIYAPIVKRDAVKRIAYAVVLEPDTEDLQQDVVSAETIELAAHGFMKDFRLVNEMHASLDKVAVPVESYLAPIDFTVTAPDGTERVIKKGSWVLASEFNEEVWKRIESGEYTGYSIEGVGRRYELGEEA